MTARLVASPDAIERAARLLVGGGTVAFPTETVYGLGARADRGEAVRGIFQAKGRPAGNPLIVHVADAAAARALAAEWPEIADRLAGAFWPGPLTLVVRRRAGAVADEVTAGGDTIGVRVPGHPVALELVTRAAVPIAAPSANRSTAISPTTADHVLKGLDGRIDVVLDGGPTPRGIESTIVDLTQEPPRLLRHGAIPLDALEAFGPVIDAAAQVVETGTRARAPGAHARHYAPRATLLVVPNDALAGEIAARSARGERIGVIDRGGIAAAPGAAVVRTLPADPDGFGAALYATLHALDDAGCDAIVVAEVPEGPRWAAVRDRLRRAAERP